MQPVAGDALLFFHEQSNFGTNKTALHAGLPLSGDAVPKHIIRTDLIFKPDWEPAYAQWQVSAPYDQLECNEAHQRKHAEFMEMASRALRR